MIMNMEKFQFICICVLVGTIGLCVGSFLNVVIYRLPRNMSLSKPGSHCPFCTYQLKWYDNIPVFSYLMLGGKCRRCKARISPLYMIVELSNVILWLLSALMFWQENIPLACIMMAVMSVYICVFLIDLKYQIIYDRFQMILLLLALVYIFFDKDYSILSHIIGGCGGFLVLFFISWIYKKLRGKEGIGGGDVKFTAVTGFLLGWERLLLGLLAASVFAAVIMLFITKGEVKNDKAFPFAPFLSVAFAVSALFGTQIVDWYLSVLGL